MGDEVELVEIGEDGKEEDVGDANAGGKGVVVFERKVAMDALFEFAEGGLKNLGRRGLSTDEGTKPFGRGANRKGLPRANVELGLNADGGEGGWPRFYNAGL